MSLAPILEQLQQKYGEAIVSSSEFRGEWTVVVAAEKLHEIMSSCKEEHQFDTLVDIASLDHFGSEPRFEMVYELYSLTHRNHLRVKAVLSCSANPKVASLVDIWPTANWHEREVFDMMGIEFVGHPNLTRILMWEGYPYYPLRKEFPLAGKSSDVPDVAFSGEAPLEGGPFVSTPGGDVVSREPRARS